MKLSRKIVVTLVAAAVTVLGLNAVKVALFLQDLAIAISPAR